MIYDRFLKDDDISSLTFGPPLLTTEMLSPKVSSVNIIENNKLRLITNKTNDSTAKSFSHRRDRRVRREFKGEKLSALCAQTSRLRLNRSLL